MKKLLLTLIFLATFTGFAEAQCNGTFANNTVCGNVTGSANLPRPTSPSSFLGAAGGTSGQTQYNNSGALGGYTPSGDVTVNPATGVETIQPGVVNSGKIATGGVATGNLAANSVTNAKLATNAIPILASRAVAIGLDLSAFTSIQTLGYTTAGDGGGATFKKVVSVPFKDTYVTAATIVGGSAYTNNTYLGVPLSGGSSNGCNSSITTSGGAVTAVSVVVPCAGYKVSDVLTTANTFIGGTGSGFTWTITAISTPLASFTDSAGNLWQYSPNGTPNVLQFGCKGDWLGTDASATNNLACLQTAAAWAGIPISSGLQFGVGNRIIVPFGNYMVCGLFNGSIYTLAIPQGVWFDGVGIFGTSLIECATNPAGSHLIELCDSNALTGQYGCRISNMVLSALQISTTTAGAALIYSNSGQQFVLAENIEADGGFKGCVKYELGKGGAANDIWIGIDCNLFNGATNPGFSFNSPTAQHILQRSVVASTGTSSLAISNIAGRLVADGIDIEGYITGLLQNVTAAGVISSYKNVQQQSGGCAQAITLMSGNIAGNLIVENLSTGCPVTISNGQAGGSNWTSNIRGPLMCVSAGACTAAVP